MSSDEKVDAWMPLWIGAYLADTMTLTTQQHGAYLLLLFAYWRNRGPLVDDDEDLASIVKASPAEWKKLRVKLSRFFVIADGKWSHGRADKELTAAGLRKAAAVSKAKAAAQARWKDSDKDAPSMPQALHEDCPTPSPLPGDIEPNGSLSPLGERPRPSVEVANALASAGIEASPDNQRIVALCEAGATVGEFTALLPASEKAGDRLAYLLTSVENGRKRASETAGQLHRGPLPNPAEEAGKAAVAETAAYLEAERSLEGRKPPPEVAERLKAAKLAVVGAA